MESNLAVFGVYSDQRELNNALRIVKHFGIKDRQVSVLRTGELAPHDLKFELFTNLRQGTAIGAMLGAVGGLGFGIFIDKLPLFIPSEVSYIVLALICTVLGTLFGAASGALVGIGTPEHLGKRYARYLSQGSVIMAVHVANLEEAQHMQTVLMKTGGAEVVSQPEMQTLSKIAKIRTALPGTWPVTGAMAGALAPGSANMTANVNAVPAGT